MTGAAASGRTLNRLLCAALAVALPVAGHAQSYDTGGVQLTFGTAMGLVATDNEGLRASGDNSSLDALFTPSFGLLTQTATSSFGFDAASDIRYGTNSDDIGLTSPRLETRYQTSSANAGLDLAASLRQLDLSEERLAIRETDGPGDFINGTATRQSRMARAQVDWGREALAAFSLSARLNDTRYSSGEASGLNGDSLSDNNRMTFAGTAALDVTQALQLDGRLSYSRFDNDASAEPTETIFASTGVSLDRPLGALSTELNVTQTGAGHRYGLSAGRTLTLPAGPITAQIGAVRLPQGETAMTGKISALRTLALSEIGFELSRDVSSLNEQDSARLTTRMMLNYTQALSQDTNLLVRFDMVQARDIATDAESFDASVDTVYSRALTRDWTADVGYSYRYIDDRPGDTAEGNTAFVTLRRKFVTRY